MDIQQIKNFLVLCRTLNYREAAAQISIVQPALSRQIQQLEEEIGALLFNRNKRNVHLTEAGLYFQVACERIVQDLEKASKRAAQIHKGEAGEIKIGHASSAMQLVLPQFLVKLKTILPNIKTQLIEISNRQLIDKLLNRQIDIGFAPNILPPTEIGTKVVYEENFVVLLPENHPISKENFTDLSIFAKEEFILPPFSEGFGYVETLYQVCHQHGFHPKIAHESAYSTSVQRLVEAGIGISIEPLSSVGGISMNIKTIELENVPQKVQMICLWLEERSSELARFLEIVTEKKASLNYP
jgi:DNA-binding transcriptional LysR family regulator